MHLFRVFPFALALGCLLAACGGGGSSGGGGVISTPVPVPTATVAQTISTNINANAALYQAVNGPDGRVWFSEFENNAVAAVTTGGTVTEYAMPPLSQPNGITVGSDGNIWTGGYGGVLLKVVPTTGAFTSYPVANAHFSALTLGPDNNVWFTDYGNNAVGNITPAGTVTSFPMPAGWSPSGIAKGNDGNLWIAASSATSGAIVKMTTAGVATTYTTGITTGAQPNYIINGPDGNLYYTEPFFSATVNDKIGRVTTSGTITEIGAIAPSSYPNELAIGKDGNVYFDEYDTENLGKITVATGAVSESALGITGTGHSGALVNGPDNYLWLGQTSAIYRLSY